MSGELMMLPHECPHCGQRFGWGEDIGLLAVVDSVPFDEPAPCCGGRLIGTIKRSGAVTFISEGDE